MNEISDFCKQYQYLQFEKPSGVEVEISVNKTLAMDLLKGGPTGLPPGSDKVNMEICEVFFCITFTCTLHN